MKKTLLLGLLTLTGLSASAQLPDGSTAPDFTTTDINGNTHTLSEYLAAGKTVILDVSATWCGPCWNYHSSHALSDLHNSYGPWGSNEVVVLFVEGDAQTTLADIYGTGGNTQGNWTDGSTYPIIDDASIASLYQIAYFPTVYRICPDGKVTEIGAQNPSALRSGISSGCQELTGLQNHAQITTSNRRICESGESVSISASVKNYGANAISNAVAVLMEDGAVVATKEFNGNVSTFGNTTITFDEYALDSSKEYEVAIESINSGTPASPYLSKTGLNVATAAEVTNNVRVHVYTDNYPGEISWRIKGSDNTIVAQGGPYQAGPGNAGAGGPDANTTKVHEITLPEGMDCYTVEMLDQYGDGWSLGNTYHGMEFITSDGSAHFITAANFGSTLVQQNALRTNGTLSNDNFETADVFAIYPNPSTGVFNFSTNEEVSVTILDITGKVVFTADKINNGGSVNLSSLQKGMYIAKVNGAASERVEKIVIN